MELLREHSEGLICAVRLPGRARSRVRLIRTATMTQPRKPPPCATGRFSAPDNYYLEIQDHGILARKGTYQPATSTACQRKRAFRSSRPTTVHYIRAGRSPRRTSILVCIQTNRTVDDESVHWSFGLRGVLPEKPKAEMRDTVRRPVPRQLDNTAENRRPLSMLEFDVRRDQAATLCKAPDRQRTTATYFQPHVLRGSWHKYYGEQPEKSKSVDRLEYEISTYMITNGLCGLLPHCVRFHPLRRKPTGIPVGPGQRIRRGEPTPHTASASPA